MIDITNWVVILEQYNNVTEEPGIQGMEAHPRRRRWDTSLHATVAATTNSNNQDLGQRLQIIGFSPVAERGLHV